MGTQIAVPSPQRRYLEPYKNRTFQYDTKHSNLFLSRYTNQILNAVGDDSIVRGLEVTPEVNSSKTGITFKIAPGALVQDLTYFEFQKDTFIDMEDISDFSDYYIVIYTNYRYLETVYENPLKFEATFYNPRMRRALSAWNSANNRIILGVYSFSIDERYKITEVTEEDTTIFFEESNVVKNGTFDSLTTEFWTPINSILTVAESGGALDSPYVAVNPRGEEFQGIAQVFTTKPNITYDVSFYVKSDESVPFEALVLDKNSIYTIPTAQVVSKYESTATKRWTLHTFRFTAFSTQSTLALLKKSESLDNNIYFDHICSFEYIPTRKKSKLHNISMIDGGRIPDSEDIIPEESEESCIHKWTFPSKNDTYTYEIDSTAPPFRSPRKGSYIVFFGGSRVNARDYFIDWKNNKITFNSVVGNSIEEISIYYISNPDMLPREWTLTIDPEKTIYSPLDTQEAFQDPTLGKYIVFFNSAKLDEADYSVDYISNIIRINPNAAELLWSNEMTILFISDPVVSKSWLFNSVVGRTTYYLTPGAEPFLDESKGRYLVFLGGAKVVDEDYLIKPEEGCISLGISPRENNVPLRIYYFGDEEPVDETPVDYDYDVYKWKFDVNRQQTEYFVDEARDPIRKANTGYYIGFDNEKYLRSFLFTPLGKPRNAVTFSRTALADGKSFDIYFIKKPEAGKYFWSMSAAESGAHSFSPLPSESQLQDPAEGCYMVFFKDKKLLDSQFNILYAANQIQISSTIDVRQGDSLQVLFLVNPITWGFWEFDTIAGTRNYSPRESEKNFSELGDGEFLFFINGNRVDKDRYKVDPLRNVLTFINAPVISGEKCELYFLGKE